MIDDILQIAIATSPALIGGAAWKITGMAVNKKRSSRSVDSDEELIDGRTRKEWYDLIRGMGKKDFELLTAAPIDVARDDDGNWTMDHNPDYAWNTLKLMGGLYYYDLMREWYPERFCKHCRLESCNDLCSGARREQQYTKERERRMHINSNLALKKSDWVQHNKPKSIVNLPRDTVNFTTIRDTKTGMEMYRVNYNDRTWEFTKADIRDFQSRFRLRPTGIVDQDTQRVITRVLKHGLPVKNDRHEAGFTWNIKAASRPGVIIVTASSATHTVTEKMLEEAAADLMEGISAATIKDKLAKAKDVAKERDKLIPDFMHIEKMNKSLEHDLNEWRKEMNSMTRREREYQYKMYGYSKYDDPWGYD